MRTRTPYPRTLVPDSAIARLVAFHGGPTAASRKMGGSPNRVVFGQWVARGWSSPMYFQPMQELLLPESGVTIKDLHDDRAKANAAAKTDERP